MVMLMGWIRVSVPPYSGLPETAVGDLAVVPTGGVVVTEVVVVVAAVVVPGAVVVSGPHEASTSAANKTALSSVHTYFLPIKKPSLIDDAATVVPRSGPWQPLH
jgi:hypothetical protein